jgi:hypothetical protein
MTATTRVLKFCSENWLTAGRAAVTFFVPLFAVWASVKALWILLPSEWFETRTLSTLDLSKLSGFARAIDGRMTFSIMSLAILGAALVAVVLSGVVVERAVRRQRSELRLGIVVERTVRQPGWVVFALFVAAVTAVGFGLWEGNPSGTTCQQAYASGTVGVDKGRGFRVIVIDNIMCMAERSAAPQMRTLSKTQRMVIFNTYVGFFGAAAVIAAFAALAMRYGDDWKDIVSLRRRLDDFRTLTLMAGVLFVLNALVTKALVNWAQGLLADENDVASFARLGSALLNYWAAQSSVVLFLALGLPALFIQQDINAAAPQSSGSGEAKWKKDNDLTFDSATVVSATIGVVAPLLAGPAFDLVTKALH